MLSCYCCQLNAGVTLNGGLLAMFDGVFRFLLGHTLLLIIRMVYFSAAQQSFSRF